MTTHESITSLTDSGILTIRFDRPESKNTIGPPMVKHLCAQLDQADADDSIKAVVFTGSGDSFCAGADLSTGSLVKPADADMVRETHRDFGGVLALRIYSCTKPVIGAVNGVAAGLGATMLLPMDVRIASENARFGFVFSRRGIVPEACSTWFLPRIVGISRAMQWTMSGRILDSDEALNGGLLTSVHPADQLLDEAYRVAAELTSQSSPLSVSATRRQMWNGLTQSHPMEAHRVETELIRSLARKPDSKEGIKAFLEHRPAQFNSRPSKDLDEFAHFWTEPPFEL
ncbi:enoyl-CoA hydratase-related protein [Nocardia sp. 348MFTsu5.1]|uniref:enoyl-CoA hydratase-related protein n=1 Tax=Nocardia sp. 348MFTsu5.1 TaxID=1172185 RepID=UPI00037ED8C4|nr:enoyl-CoA hydratase-related protein [Nocardia sp. 348MFTsu5.1]